MANRIYWMDALRGGAIFLMVFAHSLAWNFEDWHIISDITKDTPINVINAGILWHLIYSFHMALFFMISGFFSYKKNINIMKEIYKKSKRLLIPYVFSGFLLLIIRESYGYWFLFSLWEICIFGVVINAFLNYFNSRNSLIIDIFVILFIFVFFKIVFKFDYFDNPICDVRKGLDYMLPFFVGFIIRKYNFKWERLSFTSLLFLFSILFISKYIRMNNLILVFIVDHLRFYLLPIVGSLFITCLFYAGLNKYISKILSYLGNVSIEIYICHVFFVISIPSVGSFWLQSSGVTVWTTQIVYGLMVSAISIILSIIVSKVLSKCNIVKQLLFGK